MKSFDYIAAGSIAETCRALAQNGPDARILAGGTDALVEWRRPAATVPKVVLDISLVSELAGIAESNGRISIKPLATHSQLVRSDVLRRFAPLLSSAAATIGSPQVRNRGTVGGNIMNAAPCADTVPPLLALGATVTLQSEAGTRELDLGDLFLKPYQTIAKPDELLTAIHFPKLPANARSAFIRLSRRNALSISRLSVAVVLCFDGDGRIAQARLVPGAAFPTWRRATDAEQALVGEKPGEKLFAAAGRKVAQQMVKETGQRWSTEYKEPVIAALVRRALEQCALSPIPVASPQSMPSPRGAEEKQDEAARGRTRRKNGRPSSECTFHTTINGRSCALTVPASRTLLELLREDLGLTATKCGCEIGECGACTVLLDGQAVNACLVLALQITGRQVVTVEGLMQHGGLHPLQEAFLDRDAVHCGFCTPGMLLSAKALLDENPNPTETEIRAAISGNLCRCTGYQQIVEAIQQASAGCSRQTQEGNSQDQCQFLNEHEDTEAPPCRRARAKA